MLSCKTHNVDGYKVSMSPVGIRRFLKGKATYSWSEMATWTTPYYLLSYFSSQVIDFILQAEDTSDKPLAMLNYKWRLMRKCETEDIFKATGEGILRGSFEENRTLESELRIPVEHVSSGEYVLEVVIYHDKQIIADWLPMAVFNVANSAEWQIQLMIVGASILFGILGIFIGHFWK